MKNSNCNVVPKIAKISIYSYLVEKKSKVKPKSNVKLLIQIKILSES